MKKLLITTIAAGVAFMSSLSIVAASNVMPVYKPMQPLHSPLLPVTPVGKVTTVKFKGQRVPAIKINQPGVTSLQQLKGQVITIKGKPFVLDKLVCVNGIFQPHLKHITRGPDGVIHTNSTLDLGGRGVYFLIINNKWQFYCPKKLNNTRIL